MEVLRYSREGQFDVYLQTQDIQSSWERFRGRIAYGNNTSTPYHYANYNISKPSILQLYHPVEHIYEKVSEIPNKQWTEIWPVIYETNSYQFTIRIAHIDPNTCPKVKHVRRKVEELFFYDEDQGTVNVKLVGQIDFINEPGLFKLTFEYVFEGHRHEVDFSFDVVSPKLDTKNDYKSIIRTVDKEYENIVFRYLSLTYQQFNKGRINNDVIWLNTFENLVEHYIRHIFAIVNQPHTQLKNEMNYAKAERIKRWTNRMAEDYAERKVKGQLETHYFGYEEPITTVDSPENRFVKYTVIYLYKKLDKVIFSILQNDKGAKRGEELAESRKMQLTGYRTKLKKLSHHPFFRGVGRWQGLVGESFVLQSCHGYMQVYKDWLKLKQGINLYNGAASVGTLQIWEIYELWCFIKMKQFVANILCLPEPKSPNYEKLVKEPRSSILNPFIGSNMEHTVEFAYPSEEEVDLSAIPENKREETLRYLKVHQGDIVSLHYQHTFSRKNQDGYDIHTATTEQRPDIVINIKKASEHEPLLTYLYDAKYRVYNDAKLDKDFEESDIEEQQRITSGNLVGADYPPSDAINQMHRYRDAIYYGSKLEEQSTKEVIGGYILFPGRGDDNSITERYFSKSISTVNIGAFPLMPNEDKEKEGLHLRHHLEDILLHKELAYKHVEKAIPQRGLVYVEEDKSPIVMIGYARGKANYNLSCTSHCYYIRAMKKGKIVSIPDGINEAQYLLLYKNKQRAYFEIINSPKFVLGVEIKSKGFECSGEDTDIYILFEELRLLSESEELNLPNKSKLNLSQSNKEPMFLKANKFSELEK